MGKFNEYSQKAIPADNDTLMIYDATSKANKLSPFSGIWNWIVGKLTNAVISNLQTNNKTVLGAINELNNNRFFAENIGDTTVDNHAKIDRNIDFEAISWINPNYDKTFGNQWCFVKSIRIDQAGYAFQFIISCQLKTAVASRYCDKGTWGKWSIIS